jgi:hypothetical protein
MATFNRSSSLPAATVSGEVLGFGRFACCGGIGVVHAVLMPNSDDPAQLCLKL